MHAEIGDSFKFTQTFRIIYNFERKAKYSTTYIGEQSNKPPKFMALGCTTKAITHRMNTTNNFVKMAPVFKTEKKKRKGGIVHTLGRENEWFSIYGPT